jgi:nitroreductase
MLQQNEKSHILEEIISSRRSVRKFSEEVPAKADIEKIILMGLNAPYAAAAVGANNEFRRFFVVSKNSVVRKDLEIIVDKHIKAALKKINSIPARLMGVSKKLANLSDRLRNAKLPDAPFIIIVAELNGIPSVAPQAMAHAAENMWLMATAKRLGFQLISMFESMNKNEELCKLLGIEPGAYSLLGCAIGFAAQEMGPVKRVDPEMITKWL